MIAGSYIFASRWAQSQNLRNDEWFYPDQITDIFKHRDFHVILVAEGIEHVSNKHVDTMLTTAWAQGKKK